MTQNYMRNYHDEYMVTHIGTAGNVSILLTDLLARLHISHRDFDQATDNLPQLVSNARSVLLNSPFPDTGAYVGHSGGKDSVVVRWLVDQIHPEYPTLHNTKYDGTYNAVHPATRDFMYYLSTKRIINFAPLHADMGPAYAVQIDGTRQSEYNRDDGRSVDVVIDGKPVSRKDMPAYIPNGLFGKSFVYPIYDWSDTEVWACIIQNEIQFSEEYLLVNDRR